MSGTPGSKRSERRAAERLARRGRPAQPAARTAFGSPIVRLSVGALLVGAVLVAVAFGVTRPGGSDAGAEIKQPVGPAAPADLVRGRTVGRLDAPVQIEEWSDFQCPVCGRYAEEIESLLRAGYIPDGKVQLTYRDLSFIGPESHDAAVAARVSEAIGPGFWPMHDLLFANQNGENEGAFARDRLALMAVSLGMDRAAFLAALDDPQYRTAVASETAEGNAAGISRTPTEVINGTAYPGLPDWVAFTTLIDSLVAAPSPSVSPLP